MNTKRPTPENLPLLHIKRTKQKHHEPVSNFTVKSEFGYKLAILAWLAVHNSVNTILTRNSRTRKVDEMFLPTVAVFMTELIKFALCLILVAVEEGGIKQLFFAIVNQVFGNLKDTVKVCVPAMIYTVQNNLFFIAASHLDAATFMVTSQLKIFTAALFAVLILKHSLSKTQYSALLILFIGVCLVQLQPNKAKLADNSNENPVIGVTSVVVACLLSGFAGIYFEKILTKTSKVSIWMRNIQLGMFAMPASLGGVLLQDGFFVTEHGLLYGFDMPVWVTVFWCGIGGLSVAVCIKYAGNIAKNFATSVSIILATFLSVYLFGFQPSLTFSVGALFVIFSIFLYSSSQTLLQIMYKLRDVK